MCADFPDDSVRTISSATEIEDLKLSVTDSDTSESFSKEMKSILFYNDGDYACYINIDSTATTNNFKLPSKSAHSIDIPCTTPHAICASGESCTLYIRGIR